MLSTFRLASETSEYDPVNAGAVHQIVNGNFNGDTLSYTPDTNVHAYEIMYFMAAAWFYIDDLLIHRFTPTDHILASEWTLPINATSINSGSGTASGTLEVWASSILRIGEAATSPVSVHQAGLTAGIVLKGNAGILHSLAISGVANNSVITLYDNTAASGTVLYTTGAQAANATPFSVDLHEVQFDIGLTISITTAASTVTVIYE